MIPEINIGMVGHVAHGKTTLTEALTGKLTLTHSEELKRGITIRLGYADATFYKCKNGHYITSEKCPICFSDAEILRTVSFIDAPGHETLMATVLTGASLMDGALLLVAANEKCPQPQTREHLTALEVVGIKNVIIVQNKIDLVTPERAMENYNEIKNFIKGGSLENSPIIPVSAQQKVNIDSLIESIEETIPTPERDSQKDPKMLVVRSFDINKPGNKPKDLVGGIVGGALVSGNLKVGDEIELSPGIRNGNKYVSLKAEVVGLQKANRNMDIAGPGGLLGVMTSLDPSLTKSDALVGNIAGLVGKLPPPTFSLNLQIKIIQRSVGLNEPVSVKVNDELMVNVGTARSIGKVSSMKKDKTEMNLKIPVIIEKNDRVAISKLIAGRWRLIGYGTIL
ncbi:MAG: translation initiation factor IF-2 subunit gamma [Candidatus Aenigmarchaeota archaeon]|nr:translation initiation factor IF-2 subunit gamma [Candidatus Aenigmarchaeota archaeon]